MLNWIRRYLSRASGRYLKRPLPESLWQANQARYSFLSRLDPVAQTHLRELVSAFLQQKEFYGANGLMVTDAMALAVASQACLPLINLAPRGDITAALRWYDDFIGIVLHPGEVVARREITDQSGVVHNYRENLVGEAMDGGPVMLSWAAVDAAGQTSEQGFNVVIHEFAHKIDLQDGHADGCPPLPAGFMNARNQAQARQIWITQLQAEFEKFRDQVAAFERFSGLVEPPWLDPYAASAISEFFAVAAEAYFVNPDRLCSQSPGLHQLLDHFFRPQESNSIKPLRP